MRAGNLYHPDQSVCKLITTQLRGQNKTAANMLGAMGGNEQN